MLCETTYLASVSRPFLPFKMDTIQRTKELELQVTSAVTSEKNPAARSYQMHIGRSRVAFMSADITPFSKRSPHRMLLDLGNCHPTAGHQ